MTDYILRMLEPRTLKLRANLPKFVHASWARRTRDAGEFELTVHRDHVNLDDLNRDALFEVLRKDADDDKYRSEFAGIIRRASYNVQTEQWTLSGPDIKGFFLSSRVCDPLINEFDEVLAVPNETAIKHYIAANLTAPEDALRNIANELDVAFSVAPDLGRFGPISYSARWQNLHSVIVDILAHSTSSHDTQPLDEMVECWHRLDIVGAPAFYEYETEPYHDASASTGHAPVVFGIGPRTRGNIASGEYLEDRTLVWNAVYALGTGDGPSRAVQLVTDADSLDSGFRREGVLDARQANTDDKLIDEGQIAMAQTLAAGTQATFEPLITSSTRYRREWDVGYIVTADFSDIGKQVDVRIEEVQVELDGDVERITVTLGKRSQSIGKIVSDLFGRTVPAQVQ